MKIRRVVARFIDSVVRLTYFRPYKIVFLILLLFVYTRRHKQLYKTTINKSKNKLLTVLKIPYKLFGRYYYYSFFPGGSDRAKHDFSLSCLFLYRPIELMRYYYFLFFHFSFFFCRNKITNVIKFTIFSNRQRTKHGVWRLTTELVVAVLNYLHVVLWARFCFFSINYIA